MLWQVQGEFFDCGASFPYRLPPLHTQIHYFVLLPLPSPLPYHPPSSADVCFPLEGSGTVEVRCFSDTPLNTLFFFFSPSFLERLADYSSDDILDIIMRLVSPKHVIISTPTFGMYKFLGTIAGIEIVDVPRRPDFSVDVDAVRAAIRKYKATICFLPSPNNPTGTVLPNADAELILQEDCLLVCDEAYADFCDVTALSLFSKYENLIVCRTFSKWAGLAGTSSAVL